MVFLCGLGVNHPLLTPGVSSKSQAALTVAGAWPWHPL